MDARLALSTSRVILGLLILNNSDMRDVAADSNLYTNKITKNKDRKKTIKY